MCFFCLLERKKAFFPLFLHFSSILRFWQEKAFGFASLRPILLLFVPKLVAFCSELVAFRWKSCCFLFQTNYFVAFRSGQRKATKYFCTS